VLEGREQGLLLDVARQVRVEDQPRARPRTKCDCSRTESMAEAEAEPEEKEEEGGVMQGWIPPSADPV
jgi:hypothetical protein